MDTITGTEKKQTSFRLSTDLLNRLKTQAKKEHRSLNNYVEYLLIHGYYADHQPNAETLAAIEEAKAGKYAGTIDMTDFNSFMKSINDIK